MKKKLSLLMIAFLAVTAFAVQASNEANDVSESTWTVAGSPATLFGAYWEPAAAANDMTLTDGVYKWTKTDVSLAAQTVVEFKVCKDHAWDTAYPSSNYKLTIPEDGKYTLEITFDGNETVNAVATRTGDAEIANAEITKVQICGATDDSWNNRIDFDLAKGEGDVYSGTLSVAEPGDDVEFKLVVNESTWIGNGQAAMEAPEGWVENMGNGNFKLKNSVAGYASYTFTATWVANPIAGNGWTVKVEGKDARVKDVTIAPESGDISAALTAELAGNAAKDVTINLTKDAAYTLTAPITAGGNIVINGNGATIDASGNADDIIKLNGTTALAKKADGTDSDHKLISTVTISGVKILGMTGALVTDAQKTLVETLTIQDAVIEMPAAGKNVLNFNGKGYVGKAVVKNSTIYAKGGNNNGFFAQYGSRPKNVNADLLQEFDVENSTFVGIANGKNFCDLKQNGTAQNVYTLKNNIFINCGKQNQVVVGFNKGQASPTPVWTVEGNNFNWTADGALTDVTAAEMEKAGKAGEEYIVKKSILGVVAFATETALADGNFKLANCAQNTAHIGDPRWLDATVEPEPEDITIAPESGDIIAALFDATTAVNKKAKDITINLTAGAAYTVSGAIKTAGNLTINGNGSTIDASNAGDFIKLDGTTAVVLKADGTDSGHKLISTVTISGVKILGMTGALVTDAQKTLVETLTIQDAVIEMPAAGKNVLNFNGKGYVGKAIVKNSTIYAKGGNNNGFFAQYGSRPKNIDGEWLQEFDVQNSTFVGIANGKNFCDLKQNGSAQNVYTIKNNIFVDCGKNGQVVVGFNKGQTSATPVWDVDGNTFNITADGVLTDNNAAEIEKAGKVGEEDIVKNCVAGAVVFKDAANGDFTLDAASEQAKAKTGDPRWLGESDPSAVSAVKVNADSDDAPAYNLSGQHVSKAYKGIVIKNGRKMVVK